VQRTMVSSPAGEGSTNSTLSFPPMAPLSACTATTGSPIVAKRRWNASRSTSKEASIPPSPASKE
jgi:hypothetical protein